MDELESKHPGNAPVYVYLMRRGSYYKVGHSKAPSVRLANLYVPPEARDEDSAPMELLHQFVSASAPAVEKALHLRLSDHLVHGEWFALPLNLVAWLCSIEGPCDRPEDLPGYFGETAIPAPLRVSTSKGRRNTPIQLYFSTETFEELSTLAKRNLRSLSAEVRRAIERHLAAPEVIVEQSSGNRSKR